jgi:anti-anti-sigma factor
MGIDIERTKRGDGERLRLTGELDHASGDALIAQLEATMARAGSAPIELDLSAVSFVDSAGIRALILIDQLAKERGLPLVVQPPPEPLLELLQIAGLGGRLNFAGAEAPSRTAAPFLERIEMELPREVSAPAQARAELRRAIEPRVAEIELATATLLTSELVTNAVVHPPTDDGAVGMTITAYPDHLRVEVCDPGPGFDPATPAPRPTQVGGRGLLVVDRLATRWGTSRAEHPDGDFCVWFEMDIGEDQAGTRAKVASEWTSA